MSVEKALRYVNLLLSQFPHNEVAFKSQRTVVSSYKSIPESKSCGFSPTLKTIGEVYSPISPSLSLSPKSSASLGSSSPPSDESLSGSAS